MGEIISADFKKQHPSGTELDTDEVAVIRHGNDALLGYTNMLQLVAIHNFMCMMSDEEINDIFGRMTKRQLGIESQSEIPDERIQEYNREYVKTAGWFCEGRDIIDIVCNEIVSGVISSDPDGFGKALETFENHLEKYAGEYEEANKKQ